MSTFSWFRRWRWHRFYLEWLKTGFVGPYRWVTGIAWGIPILIVVGIEAYKHLGGAISQRLEGNLIALQWMIPAAVFGGLALPRLIAAPYLIYKRRSVALADEVAEDDGFEPQGGFLDFASDFPKATLELLKQADQVLKHMSDVDIALRRRGYVMLMSVAPERGPEEGLKQARSMAKDLRTYEKRMRRTHGRLEGAAERFCEDQAGLVTAWIQASQRPRDLAEAVDGINGFQRTFERTLNASDLKDKLQSFVDERASRTLSEASRRALVVLQLVENVYGRVADSCEAAIATIQQRASEIA